MNLRTLLFLARKDLLKDLRVLLLVLLAVGSGALAIVPLGALMEGFTAHVAAITIDVSTGHVILSPDEKERYVRHAKETGRRIEGLDGVAGVSARLMDRALAINGDKSEPLVVRGVDPQAEAQATTIADHLVRGRFLAESDQDAIVLGQSLADKIGARVGRPVFIQFGNGGRARFKLRGTYSTGLRDLDSGGYASLKQLQNVLGLRNRASEIAVRLTDEDRAQEYQSQIEALVPDVTVETWRDRMGFIDSMRGNMRIIQSFMVMLSLLAAGIAITVLMYTSIQHKVRSIGILKAIGARDRDVLVLYVIEGVVLGVAGAIVGDILGSAFTLYLSATPINVSVGASEGGAAVTSLRAVFSWNLLILPTVSAILITLLASFYPAWQASRINIMEAIWHE